MSFLDNLPAFGHEAAPHQGGYVEAQPSVLREALADFAPVVNGDIQNSVGAEQDVASLVHAKFGATMVEAIIAAASNAVTTPDQNIQPDYHQAVEQPVPELTKEHFDAMWNDDPESARLKDAAWDGSRADDADDLTAAQPTESSIKEFFKKGHFQLMPKQDESLQYPAATKDDIVAEAGIGDLTVDPTRQMLEAFKEMDQQDAAAAAGSLDEASPEARQAAVEAAMRNVAAQYGEAQS